MSPITTIINAAHAPIVTVTVDKLALVRHVPDQSRAYLKAQFLGLKDDEPAIFIIGGSRAGYRVNIRGTLPGPTIVLFQCDPHNASLPFIRLELNPSKNASAGASPLSPYFEWMFDFGFAEFASKAKVTRLDIAIDIEGRGLPDIVCGTVKSTRSASYAGKGGEPETLYLGRVRGTPFAIYNKSLQLKVPGARTRIEKRTKPECFLPEVGKGKNPLVDLRVYEADTFRKALALAPLESTLLCNLAQAKGIRGALANSGALHSVLKARIEAAPQSAWWDPHHFWTLVPDCLVACGLLQGDKPAGSPPLKVGVLPANEQLPHGSQLPVS